MSQDKSHNRNIYYECKEQTEVAVSRFIITVTGNPADYQTGNQGGEQACAENDYSNYKQIEKSPLLHSVDSEWLNQSKK